MSESTLQIEALSPECEVYLASQELYSTADHKIDCVQAKIYTLDGEFVTKVSASISLFDLRSLVELKGREYTRGFEAGKSAKQHELRAVLGIAN